MTIERTKQAYDNQLRVDRFGRVLRLTDRILSPTVRDLKVVDYGEAPAWTDGKVIYLNSDMLPTNLHKAGNVATWLGANYHELGHVLYTPRNESPLLTRIRTVSQTYMPQAHRVWNMIEDQRQERLMVAQFAPLRTYLQTVATSLIVDSGDVSETWCLLAGRTWLPQAVRDASRKAWAKEHGAASALEVARIIGDYQRLTDTGFADSDAAFTLVSEMVDLLGATNVEPAEGCGTQMGAGEEDAAGTEAVEAADDDTPEDAPEQGAGDESGDDADEGDEDGDGGAGDGSEDDEDTDTEGEGEGSGKGDDESDKDDAGNSAGSSEGKDKEPQDIDDLLDAIDNAIQDAIKNDDAVADDMADIQDALDKPTQEAAHGNTDRSRGFTPTPEHQASRRNVEDAMRRIMDMVEPAHIRRTDHGKVNVRRYATAERFDGTTLFDRFDNGQEDEVSVEVVVLLDRSGSMGGSPLVAASAATWSVLHAVDRLEGKATVLTYTTQHGVMHTHGDRPTADVALPQAGGGTDPTSALTEAYRLLSESDASHRILLSVTDGQWYNGAATVEALKQDGIITAMVHIDAMWGQPDDSATARRRGKTHKQMKERALNGHEFFIGSADGADIAPMFESIATDAMMSGITR